MSSGLFGRIPSVGESYIDESGIEFEITATEGNAITGLLIKNAGYQRKPNRSVTTDTGYEAIENSSLINLFNRCG